MLASIILIVGMGCWTNYLTELTDCPIQWKRFSPRQCTPVGRYLHRRNGLPLWKNFCSAEECKDISCANGRIPNGRFLVSALIFGIVHGNPVQMFFASILGLVLGWVYYRTGSLLPCMLMHFINNGTSVLLFHLPGRGRRTMTEALGTTRCHLPCPRGCSLDRMEHLVHQDPPDSEPDSMERNTCSGRRSDCTRK